MATGLDSKLAKQKKRSVRRAAEAIGQRFSTADTRTLATTYLDFRGSVALERLSAKINVAVRTAQELDRAPKLEGRCWIEFHCRDYLVSGQQGTSEFEISEENEEVIIQSRPVAQGSITDALIRFASNTRNKARRTDNSEARVVKISIVWEGKDA